MSTISSQDYHNRRVEVPPTIQKKEAFIKFVEFCALPDPEKCEFMKVERDPTTGKYKKTPTMTDFAIRFGVSRESLTLWKRYPEFLFLVDIKRKQWGLDKVPNVLAALYTRCIKYGMAYDVETYLGYFAGWSRAQIAKTDPEKFDADDIRSIIKMLPAEKQKEVYGKLADLIGEAQLAGSNTQGDRNLIEGHSNNQG